MGNYYLLLITIIYISSTCIVYNYINYSIYSVRNGFDESLGVLKRSHQVVATEDDGYGGKKQSNQNIFRIKESAYEALGFSDNMSYEKRSELRKECSKFLRFAYLVDFMAMQSLSNIFVLSVQELEENIKVLVDGD